MSPDSKPLPEELERLLPESSFVHVALGKPCQTTMFMVPGGMGVSATKLTSLSGVWLQILVTMSQNT